MFFVFPRLRLRVSLFALPALTVMLWLEGVLPFLLLVLSAAVHEAGHIAAIKLLGYRARRIDILPMGALIVCPEGIPYIAETIIALSGPIASLSATLISCGIYLLNENVFVLFFAFVNLVLGIFNLLPISKNDGGKALYCFLLHKNRKNCRKIASAASVCAKISFVIAVAVCIVLSGCNFGVILLSAALILQL